MLSRVSARTLLITALILQTPLLAATAATNQSQLQLLSVKKIWDAALHNAFTDLIRFNDAWWCTFRESQAHVGGNGKIRVLHSTDGDRWDSAALLNEDGVDLRDPKLTVTSENRLMLNMGGSVYAEKVLQERQSRVAFSTDGTNWTVPQRILEKGDWLWRVTWQGKTAYGIAYRSGKPQPGKKTDPHAGMTAKLVATDNGTTYRTITELDISGSPNESTLRFLPNGDCVALVRREVDDKEARIGKSSAPYTKWTWHSAGMRIGGPNFLMLNDGRMIASGRKSDPTRTATFVGEMTMTSVTPDLILPSGGDCSYPGMVWHDGVLWLSYYSSHEAKTSIYLARIKNTGQ